MKLSPLDIQHMEFGRSVPGYNRQQVREFLERVAEEREDLLRDMQQLRDELARKDARIEELQSTEVELKRTVIAAERIANELKENAKREAQLIVQEAERRKEDMLRETESKLARGRSELERLEREHRLFREQFRGVLEAFWRSLDNLPGPRGSEGAHAHWNDDDRDESATRSTLTRAETD